MSKKKLRGRKANIICSVFCLLFFWFIYRLYCYTEYYLVSYLAFSSFFVGTVNLLFMLLKRVSTLPKRKKKRLEKGKNKNSASFGETEKKFKASIFKSKEKTAENKEKTEETKKKKQLKKIFTSVNIYTSLCWVLIALSFIINIKLTTSFLKNFPDAGKASTPVIVALLILFFAVMVIDRVCKYVKTSSKFYTALLNNFRSFFKYFTVELFLVAMTVIFEARVSFNIRKYMGYALGFLFLYYALFTLISIVIIVIRKETLVNPEINVPMFYMGESTENGSFLEYLEKNTGISMRSLWSVKYIKEKAPIFILVSCAALYLSTAIVNVEPYQKAVVYRIGVMQENILQPGLHLVLPYPFDKVETYDTETVNKVTIGYKSEDSGDNIWTASHGSDEYKLLLGGGDELVSINLRLEYKISDLKAYLKTATSPESIMEAMAYELVMNKTIETDLSSLLSIDRDAFADNFQIELSKKLKNKNIGIEVVSVVLESIHPPVEIADVYQQLIGAGITAEERILKAQAAANVTVAKAETTRNVALANAKQNNIKKVSKANSTVAEFLKSVEAYDKYGDAYTYQKYLKAVQKAYGNANLVILGDGVDESAIFFGNFRQAAPKGDEKGVDYEG